MKRNTHPAMLLVLLLVLAACGPLRRGPAVEPGARVSVVVDNQNFYQATIYAHVDAGRVRLGEVPGFSSETFAAPSPVTGEMSIEIRLLAVGAYTSHSISVARGDTVEVVVPPHLHQHPARPRR